MLSGNRWLAGALLLLAACSGKPETIEHVSESAPARNNVIYVDNHGWHTEFIIPAQQLNASLPFLKDRFTNSPPYYEIGWGDKGFYQSHEISTGLTLRAMFASDGSVVHVVAVPEAPQSYFPDSQIIPLTLSDSEFADLEKYIRSSFARDAQGNVIILQPGLYGDSQFYEGNGTYYIFNTCNKWTARGLKSAGRDISTHFKLTASSVMEALNPAKLAPTGPIFRK